MAKPPRGPATLVAAIDARIKEIGRDCDELVAKMKGARDALRQMETDLRLFQDEQRMLANLRKLYLDESSDERGEAMVGPTEAIRTLLQNESNHRAPVGEVVERIVLAIESKTVRTESADSRKLISSIIGQMVRNGQLKRDGEYVALTNGREEQK